jgi:hypothetical protein
MKARQALRQGLYFAKIGRSDFLPAQITETGRFFVVYLIYLISSNRNISNSHPIKL